MTGFGIAGASGGGIAGGTVVGVSTGPAAPETRGIIGIIGIGVAFFVSNLASFRKCGAVNSCSGPIGNDTF